MQALTRELGERLFRVEGLVRELATLRRAFPKLAAIKTDGTRLTLEFLCLVMEDDLVISLDLGGDSVAPHHS